MTEQNQPKQVQLPPEYVLGTAREDGRSFAQALKFIGAQVNTIEQLKTENVGLNTALQDAERQISDAVNALAPIVRPLDDSPKPTLADVTVQLFKLIGEQREAIIKKDKQIAELAEQALGGIVE